MKRVRAESGSLTSLPSYRPMQVTKLPPCLVGCAATGDVRGWISIVAQRRRLGIDDSEAIARSWEILVGANPFPATLGRICPHPCESSCNRREKDEPIAIRSLERFVGDWAIDHRLALPVLESRPTGFAVGVVGSGPAGLSFAYQMARRGHAVTVFERHSEPGGMLRFGIPDYRLPPEVLASEIARITDLGVEIRLGSDVRGGAGLAELRSNFDAVFIAVGAQVARSLDIPGEDALGIHTGIAYLAAVNRGESPTVGDRVAVVGGGNTAIDAARSARRQGADVTVIYRRTRAEMPCQSSEVDEAMAEGVRFNFLESPVEFTVSRGAVSAVVTRRMRLGASDQTGRSRPFPIPGSERSIEVDSVIVAIAQEADLGVLGELAADLAAGDIGEIAPGLWVGGDAVDPSIAGAAVRHGRLAAEVVDARLRHVPEDRPDSSDPIPPHRIGFHHHPVASRPSERRAPVDDAIADPGREVAMGIDESEFFAEVERCFSCGLCSGCSQCAMYCTVGAFSRIDSPSPGRYFTVDLTACTSCGKCIEVCPGGYLEPIPSDELVTVGVSG